MNPVAQLPQEFLSLYRILVQNAPSDQVAHQHLVNFLNDARTVLTAVQTVYDDISQRNAPPAGS